MNILEKFCGLNLERDINMVNMANGMTALCVTVAQNLTPETMKVDKDKLEKLKRFLGVTEEPRWYKFTWEFYHAIDEDQLQ